MARPKKKPTPKPRRAKGTGAAVQKGQIWYGRVRKNGEEIWTEGYETEEKALEALDRILSGGVDPRTLPTLQDFWSSLLSDDGDLEHRHDYQTNNLYDTVLNVTIADTALGKMRIDTITKRDIQRHVDKLYKTYKESTVRRYGSCIRVVLQEAVERKWLRARIEGGEFIAANPADGVKFKAIPDTVSYIFSDEELVTYPELLYQFHPRLSAMVTIMADTGCRPGEVCAMNLEDIRDGQWNIHSMMRRDGTLIDSSKNGVSRWIALSEDAQAAIAEQGRRAGMVFMTRNGKPLTPDLLGTQLRRFRKNLEREEKKKAAREGREPIPIPPLHPRNLRKTFVTRGMEKSDLKSVQAAVGHKLASTTSDVYAKARQAPQKKLIDSLQEDVKRGIWRDKEKNREKN